MNIVSVVKAALNEWDSSVSNDYISGITRREFFRLSLTAGALAVFSESVPAKSLKANDAEWKIFHALHNHLFPGSIDAPGADDFNATGYLQSILQWPGVNEQDKKFLQDGTGWLNSLSKKQFQKEFYLLSADQKEKMLRQVEQSKAGESWLSLILLYLFEALLTDPVYGGNTDAIGWKWLEHQPGFPRPDATKRYFNL